MRARLIAGSAAAGWIRLVDQLRERALEALDAGASRPSDNRRMHRPRGQDHAVSGLQLEAAALAFEHEGDRSIDAVKDLLVAVAVSRVAVARAVRPRVAAGGLGFELRHQLVECRHIAILRLLG